MLALARTPTPPFPYAGSAALYDGYDVVIHQRIGDDRALIHGAGITARVAVADLAPAATAGAFDLWRDARLNIVAAAAAITPEDDLYADFVVWLETTDYDANRYVGRAAFAHALAAAGYGSAPVRRPGLVTGRTVLSRCWTACLIGDVA